MDSGDLISGPTGLASPYQFRLVWNSFYSPHWPCINGDFCHNLTSARVTGYVPTSRSEDTLLERFILDLGTILSEENSLEDGVKSKISKKVGENLGKIWAGTMVFTEPSWL